MQFCCLYAEPAIVQATSAEGGPRAVRETVLIRWSAHMFCFCPCQQGASKLAWEGAMQVLLDLLRPLLQGLAFWTRAALRCTPLMPCLASSSCILVCNLGVSSRCSYLRARCQ